MVNLEAEISHIKYIDKGQGMLSIEVMRALVGRTASIQNCL